MENFAEQVDIAANIHIKERKSHIIDMTSDEQDKYLVLHGWVEDGSMKIGTNYGSVFSMVFWRNPKMIGDSGCTKESALFIRLRQKTPTLVVGDECR